MPSSTQPKRLCEVPLSGLPLSGGPVSVLVHNGSWGAVRRTRTGLRYPYPTRHSGSEKAAPLGESGGAGQLVGVAILEVALRREVVVDQGMD
jgi:hypothetical protein